MSNWRNDSRAAAEKNPTEGSSFTEHSRCTLGDREPSILTLRTQVLCWIPPGFPVFSHLPETVSSPSLYWVVWKNRLLHFSDLFESFDSVTLVTHLKGCEMKASSLSLQMDCAEDEFSLRGECQRCPRCPPGHELKQVREASERTDGVKERERREVQKREAR